MNSSNKKKNNISTLEDCYGCGVCVGICPVKIISLEENNNGFYSPKIVNNDACINCGLCLKTCAFNHNENSLKTDEVTAYAGWSNNPIFQNKCSSGGIGFEVGKQLLNKGYKAIGVRYDDNKMRAEHYVSSNVNDFVASIGSKYIQSYTSDAFSDINFKEKYIIIGAPCQIDSIRRLVRLKRAEDNFVLVDFFCHGVPSMLMWKKYLESVHGKIKSIGFATWRNKDDGWHDSWRISIKDKEKEEKDTIDCAISDEFDYKSKKSDGDLFYSFFLGNYCLNMCCYKSCKYKMTNSSADIRLGDLWGTKYANNEAGVSGILAFTETGREIISSLSKNACTVIPESVEVVTEGQMKHSAHYPFIWPKVMAALKSEKTLEQINKEIIFRYNLLFLPQRAYRKLKSIFKK